jgi:hypothetical protein
MADIVDLAQVRIERELESALQVRKPVPQVCAMCGEEPCVPLSSNNAMSMYGENCLVYVLGSVKEELGKRQIPAVRPVLRTVTDVSGTYENKARDVG